MRIQLDAAGRIGPPEPASFRPLSIEEQQALARQEAEGLVTIRNADGSETLNHQGRFADHSIVRIGKDGKPVFECVQGEGQMRHATQPDRPAPAQEEE
jgi:hypothetical protein